MWICLGVTGLAALALTSLRWQASTNYDRAISTESDAIRTLLAVRYIDDAMTLTTRLSLASPDPRWRTQYDSLDRAMASSLDHLQRVAGPLATDALARLRAADRRLAALERAALSASADRESAARLIGGTEYAADRQDFASALDTATATIEESLEAQRQASRRRALGSIVVAVGSMFVLLVAWVGLVLLLRSHLREQRQLALELSSAKDLAEAANRSKGEFLAGMSHELRTPLTAVIGFANVLYKNKSGRLGSAELEYVGRIQRSGRHLLGLINEVLDLARLESRPTDVEIAPAELGELIRDAVALSEARTGKTIVALRIELPREPQWVETDAAKLAQVIINLVANAMKFTSQGSVTVRLLASAIDVDSMQIVVSDTGIGIAPDRLEAIFRPFEQADNSTARQFGGSGLGLAISRTIATALGGTLKATSTLGVGSEFTLTLPRHVAPAPTAASERAHRGIPSLARESRRVVLVIDDDEDARAIIAHQVEEAGADAILASSGPEGLRLAREHKPDVITLDLVMPGMPGVEVLRRLKGDPVLCEIPVIIVSVAAAKAGSLFGTLDAVSKPLEPGALRNALQRQLGPVADDGIEVLIVEDDPVMRALLVEHLHDAGAETVHAASDGREALAMLETLTPRLIVLDLLMPRMGGISFLRTLRMDMRWTNLPVIVVTGTVPDEADASLLQQEAISVLQKGDDIGERFGQVLRFVIPNGERSVSTERPA